MCRRKYLLFETLAFFTASMCLGEQPAAPHHQIDELRVDLDDEFDYHDLGSSEKDTFIMSADNDSKRYRLEMMMFDESDDDLTDEDNVFTTTPEADLNKEGNQRRRKPIKVSVQFML